MKVFFVYIYIYIEKRGHLCRLLLLKIKPLGGSILLQWDPVVLTGMSGLKGSYILYSKIAA